MNLPPALTWLQLLPRATTCVCDASVPAWLAQKLRDCGRHLLVRHDLGQRGGLRQREEHEQCAFEERDGEDLGERERMRREGNRETAERDGPTRVGNQHHTLAVPAVDQRAGWKVEEHVGERLSEPDDPGLRRRMRLRQNEQRKGHARDARPDRGDDLPAPEQDEVAITPKRRRFYRRRPSFAFSRESA